MGNTAVDELESALERDDDELTTVLPGILPDLAENPEELLLDSPRSFRELSARMATLDGIADYADDEPETVEAYLTLLWESLELISETIDSVGEAVTQEFTVTWRCTDADVAWHVETDPDEGLITGGTGELDGAELTFEGEADPLFSMLGDDEFDATQAFMQGQFQIEGPIPKAQQLGQTMETALDGLEDEALPN